MPTPKTKAAKGGSAGGTQELFAPVAAQIEDVRRRITQRLTTPCNGINEQIESIGAGQGKLFRPGLLLLSGLAAGSLRDEHTELAMMVELVHTATLLHDDVIDQAKTRRSRQTVNTLWGNKAAVLLGDFLLSQAFSAGSKISVPQADAIISKTAEQICQGELVQNLRQGDWTLNEEDYLEIIEAKTASLFAASCRLGALASDADVSTQSALHLYGLNVGRAFQITDDILDITGDDKKAGKTLGTDFLQRKLTLPIIHYLGRQKASQRRSQLEQLAELTRRELIQTLTQSQSLEYARLSAAMNARQALMALSRIPQTPAREALEKIPSAIADRAS